MISAFQDADWLGRETEVKVIVLGGRGKMNVALEHARRRRHKGVLVDGHREDLTKG